MAREPIVQRKYVKTQIPGIMGHQAPVDTTGMEPEMKATLGFGPKVQTPKKKGGLGAFLAGLLGGKR